MILVNTFPIPDSLQNYESSMFIVSRQANQLLLKVLQWGMNFSKYYTKFICMVHHCQYQTLCVAEVKRITMVTKMIVLPWQRNQIHGMGMSTPHGKAEHRRGRNRPVMLHRGPSPRSLNINPSFVHSPHTHTCTQHGRDNKGWSDSMHNTQQSYLFVPRHGGSGEPALPLTEVLDRCRKRRGSAAQVIRSVQKLISVQKDRSSYGSFSCINQVLLRLKPKEEKESGIKQRTLDTQEPNT